jgi:hypothetical protein
MIPDLEGTPAGGVASLNDPVFSDFEANPSLVAEGRIHSTGLLLQPSSTIAGPLILDERLTFTWKVIALTSGTYRNSISLWIRILPSGGGPAEGWPIWVQDQILNAHSFFTLGHQQGIWLGASGVFLGMISLIPKLKEQLRWR